MIRKILSSFLKINREKDLGEVLKGGAVAFLYRLATMGVSYLLLFFISRKLGKEGVGVFNLCLATSGILVMLGCLGFNTSIVRFVSQYRTKKYYRTIYQLYIAILKWSIVSSMAIALSLFFGAEIVAKYAFKDLQLVEPLRITAVIIPLMVLATLNVEFIRGLKMVQISEYLRNLNIQVITLTGTFFMAYYVLTPEDPLRFYAIGAGLSAVIGAFVVRRFFRTEMRDAGTIDQPEFSFKSHLSISLPMIITAFVQLINGKVDTIMIAWFETTAVVGVFSMAFKLSVITNFVIGALKTIAMPKISELFWTEKKEELDRVIQYSTLIIFFFALPISVVLFLFPDFILALIRDEFTEGSTTLRIFAVSQLINAASGMVAVFLNMSGNQVFFTRVVTVTTLANIVLNAILIPMYGMEGAAAATLVTTATWNLIGVRYIFRKYGIRTFFDPRIIFKR